MCTGCSVVSNSATASSVFHPGSVPEISQARVLQWVAISSFFFFFYGFIYFFFNFLYITVLDLPNIKMNPPQVAISSSRGSS